MSFLTETGLNLLDLIDLREERFQQQIVQIYQKLGTSHFRAVLMALHGRFHEQSTTFGKNTIRYTLIKLREELLEDILPENDNDALRSEWVYLSKGCYAFERNPILYNLPKSKPMETPFPGMCCERLGAKIQQNICPTFGSNT